MIDGLTRCGVTSDCSINTSGTGGFFPAKRRTSSTGQNPRGTFQPSEQFEGFRQLNVFLKQEVHMILHTVSATYIF